MAGLNDKIAAEFNLGAKADGLAEQVMKLIAEQPGGLETFGEKLKTSGAGARAASWGGGVCAPLTVRQVKKLVGTPFIKEVANYLEVPQGFASKILGAIIPRILALLAAPGVRPDEIAASSRAFSALALAHLRRCGEDQFVPSKEEQTPLLRTELRGARLRFIISIAALAVAAGLLGGGFLGYAISSGAANNASAGVQNSANAAALIFPLVSAVKARDFAGDFAVGAGWTKNLTAEFGSFGATGSRAFLAGNVLNTERASPHENNSASTMTSPQPARLLAHAGDRRAVRSSKANARALHPAKASGTTHTYHATWKRHQPSHQHVGFYVFKPSHIADARPSRAA
ncbi:MAG: hypothetical protein J2P49_01425 [Methylocapsa sp.]|nr:hypothetical protein [Methylocapsa sp.]